MPLFRLIVLSDLEVTMALDGIFLNCIKNELDFLVGGRIDKIAQPSREEVIISFRTHGGNVKLMISALAGSARV
ncbi:MAG: NFACT family protein, partial [Bacillota bacterium]|nr:NFACT family protein [Bacillota bacterium]